MIWGYPYFRKPPDASLKLGNRELMGGAFMELRWPCRHGATPIQPPWLGCQDVLGPWVVSVVPMRWPAPGWSVFANSLRQVLFHGTQLVGACETAHCSDISGMFLVKRSGSLHANFLGSSSCRFLDSFHQFPAFWRIRIVQQQARGKHLRGQGHPTTFWVAAPLSSHYGLACSRQELAELHNISMVST